MRPFDESSVDSLLGTRQSNKAAKEAAAAARDLISPQLARAVQATENAWRRMEREYGLLTSSQVAAEPGSPVQRPLRRA